MDHKMHLMTHKWVMPLTRGYSRGATGYRRIAGRDRRVPDEPGCMRFEGVDISEKLQVHSLQASRSVPCCAGCERRLLPGETLHVYASRSLCTLCAAVMAEEPVRRERIRATEVGLAVVPRAA
jgi:hypothetical protein